MIAARVHLSVVVTSLAWLICSVSEGVVPLRAAQSPLP